MLKDFKITNLIIFAIGVAYIYLAFALVDAKSVEDCKECEENKKNFKPVFVEVPDNDNSED